MTRVTVFRMSDFSLPHSQPIGKIPPLLCFVVSICMHWTWVIREKATVGKNVDLSTKHLSKSHLTLIIWVKGKEKAGSLMSVLLPGLVWAMPAAVWNLGLFASFQGLQAFTPVKVLIHWGGRRAGWTMFQMSWNSPLALGKPEALTDGYVQTLWTPVTLISAFSFYCFHLNSGKLTKSSLFQTATNLSFPSSSKCLD